MMEERIKFFINGLIKKTKEDKLEWKVFFDYENKGAIIRELENGRGRFDYYMNSIRETKSYFLQSGGGYVFLFEIYHGDPDVTSPIMDTLGLMVKVNSTLPLECLSNYGKEEQQYLEELKLLIETNLEKKYCNLDILNDFMNQIIAD